MDSIVQMLAAQAAKNPEKVYVYDEKRALTFSQMWDMARGFAEKLKAEGIKKGAHVILKVSQSGGSLAKILGIHLAGAVFVPVEANCPALRMEELFYELDAAAYISDTELDSLKNWIPRELDYPYSGEEYEFPAPEMTADLIFTTGTTGKSKGVILSHRAVSSAVENIMKSIEMLETDITLIPGPINHTHGLRRCYAAAALGSSVILMNGVLNLKDFYKNIEKYCVTGITLAPAMLSYIFRISGDRLSIYGDKIRYIEVGSSTMPEVEKEYLMSLLPDSHFYFPYGSTESGNTCVIDYHKDGLKPLCIGKPTCNTTLTFADETGMEIEATKEKPGFIVTEGPMNMTGYYGDSELTSAVLKEGKVYSNDLAYRDESGFVYFLGRQSDVINMGGLKVSALEIENAVMQMEGIAECACIPIPDPIFGQVPKLFVVMNAGKDGSPQTVEEFLKKRLEASRLPRKIELIDRLPKTYNEKIKKSELMEEKQ